MADALAVLTTREPSAPADKPPAESRATSLRYWGALLLILAGAAALRLPALGAESLWFDEMTTLENSVGRGYAHSARPYGEVLHHVRDVTSLEDAWPWWKIWSSARWDNHPPLYFTLIRFWRELVGSSPWSVRLFSTICSLGAIVLLADALRVQHSARMALWAAVLMAVTLPQIEYAREARSYALLTLLGMGACSALARLERYGVNRRRMAALGACVLTMPLTHYFAAGVLAGIGIYALLGLPQGVRRPVVMLLAAMGIWYLFLWGPTLRMQQENILHGSGWLHDPEPGLARRALSGALDAPARLLFGPSEHILDVYRRQVLAGGLLFLLPLPLLRRRRWLLLWYCWFVCGVGFVAVSDLLLSTKLSARLRYQFIAAPGLLALVAALAWTLPLWLRRTVLGSVVLCCLLLLPTVYLPWKAQTKPVAHYLSAHGSEEDLYVFHGGRWGTWYAAGQLMDFGYYAPVTLSHVLLLDRPLDDATLAQLRGYRRVWIIAEGVPPPTAWLGGMRIQTVRQHHLASLHRLLLDEPAALTASSAKRDGGRR